MRFGIIGTGLISEWFVAACRRAGGAPVAVMSRDARRGRAFAVRHHLDAVTGSVDQLVTSGVDAIYVASPIACHSAHTLEALHHGKHVLCEKTLATSNDEAARMFAAADSANCVLLEAVRPAHDPAYRAIRDVIPQLGTIRSAHFEKCQYSSRYPSFLRGDIANAFDPASGNSALRDLGVYCVHPALDLFGPPQRVSGTSYHLANGFEGGGTIVMRYPSMTVTCTYSKTCQSATPSVILGEEGSLTIDSIAEPANVVLTRPDGHATPVLRGPAKAPKETLHHPIETFMHMCAHQPSSDPFRQRSLQAERLFSSVLDRAPLGSGDQR